MSVSPEYTIHSHYMDAKGIANAGLGCFVMPERLAGHGALGTGEGLFKDYQEP